jgi:hypothetical protein
MDAVAMAIDVAQRTDKVSSVEKIFKEKYYEKARHCIWRACSTIFADDGEKLYSFADTRQTFSANRKALNGRESAAAELGHSVTTSKDHYAPARKSWSKYKEVNTQTHAAVPAQAQIPAQGQGATVGTKS